MAALSSDVSGVITSVYEMVNEHQYMAKAGAI
jgi:hypothetical protein